jgi:hypothetical protein
MSDIGRQLDDVIDKARVLRRDLGAVLTAHGDRVHFRPTTTAVTMVGLLPATAQRGRSYQDLRKLAQHFDVEFARHCVDVDQGRPTPEKRLQSFLIRQAQTHQGRLPLSSSSDLRFVTDELAIVTATGRVVCDLLALRIDGDVVVPVVIELKSARQLTRLVEQVEAYAAVVDTWPTHFATLFGVLLEQTVSFTGPCEKWIVWPQAGVHHDPRAGVLSGAGIVVVGYEHEGDSYRFRVG